MLQRQHLHLTIFFFPFYDRRGFLISCQVSDERIKPNFICKLRKKWSSQKRRKNQVRLFWDIMKLDFQIFLKTILITKPSLGHSFLWSSFGENEWKRPAWWLALFSVHGHFHEFFHLTQSWQMDIVVHASFFQHAGGSGRSAASEASLG